MTQERPPILTFLMKINLGCAILSGIALLLMMVVGTADVIGTNLDLIGIRSQPVPAAFEFVSTMMVVSVFLAMSLAQARGTHIRVGVIVSILPAIFQKLAALLQFGLSATFFLAIAWFGTKGAFHSFNVGEYAPGLINFPVWPARLVLAFGALLMGIQSSSDFINQLFPRPGGSEVPQKPII